MSQTKSKCPSCGKPVTEAWKLCVSCASKKVQLKNASKQQTEEGNGGSAVQLWHIEATAHKSVSNGLISYFGKNRAAIAGHIVTDFRPHKNDASATDRHEEYTVKDYADSITLDYQGTRENEGVYWIDYQGQKGSKKDGRNTYFQVMIQCCGQVPGADVISLAIGESYQQGKRSVVYYKNTTARPK